MNRLPTVFLFFLCTLGPAARGQALRFFGVPWLTYQNAYHVGGSNQGYTFHDSSPVAHVGVGVNVELFTSPNFGIGIGGGYVRKGGQYTATYTATGSYPPTDVTYTVTSRPTLNYLQGPLYLKFTPHLAGPVRAYFQGGIELALLINGERNEPTNRGYYSSFLTAYDFVDAGLLAGAGLEFWIGPSHALLVGVSYHHGVVNVREDAPDPPPGPSGLPYIAPFGAEYPLKNRSWGFDLGLRLGSPPRRPQPAPTPAPPARSIQTI